MNVHLKNIYEVVLFRSKHERAHLLQAFSLLHVISIKEPYQKSRIYRKTGSSKALFRMFLSSFPMKNMAVLIKKFSIVKNIIHILF